VRPRTSSGCLTAGRTVVVVANDRPSRILCNLYLHADIDIGIHSRGKFRPLDIAGKTRFSRQPIARGMFRPIGEEPYHSVSSEIDRRRCGDRLNNLCSTHPYARRQHMNVPGVPTAHASTSVHRTPPTSKSASTGSHMSAQIVDRRISPGSAVDSRSAMLSRIDSGNRRD